MAYVHPDKPDIFISYAHVDDDPDAAFADRPGRVTTLVRCVEQRLAKKLGRVTEDHRQRLNSPTVAATDLSEITSLVVETVKKLTSQEPTARDEVAHGDTDKLVFVDAEQTDLESARTIVEFFEAHGVGALLPVRGATLEATRTALTTRMLACDGIVLVHGTNPDWPVLQWPHFRKVKPDREAPIRAIGLCDLPPPEKPMNAADVLHLPLAHVIDCRDGLTADKFATFLRAL